MENNKKQTYTTQMPIKHKNVEQKDGKIDGFKINRIANKSIFKELGLRKGDIIKGVNNIILKSYADAFKLYKNINKIDNLNFTILRDNQIMEMEYDIK